MAEYPPYVNAPGSLFKFSLRHSVRSGSGKGHAGLSWKRFWASKSSSHRAYIPLMKKLGFIDGGNVPTQAYKDYRDPRFVRHGNGGSG